MSNQHAKPTCQNHITKVLVFRFFLNFCNCYLEDGRVIPDDSKHVTLTYIRVLTC